MMGRRPSQALACGTRSRPYTPLPMSLGLILLPLMMAMSVLRWVALKYVKD